MHKIISIYFLQLFIALSCMAAEPALAMLRSTESNNIQKFSFANTHFACKVYGVISLEELYHHTKTSDGCKAKIQSFYQKNPQLKYFSATLLKRKQLYHLEFRTNECIVYAQGQMTLSELLLKNGLGVLKPQFQDKEFQYAYKKAQRNARLHQRGIWADETFNLCILQEEER